MACEAARGASTNSRTGVGWHDADYLRRLPSMIGNYREISEIYVDLSNPLAVVTPTLDAAVLLALAATTGWATGAQVHRMAGAGSDDGVRRVLARLVDQGIVLADQHPHATLYSLNRNHVAADAIVSLTRLRAEIIDRIGVALKNWSPSPPVHASLFGSFARGRRRRTATLTFSSSRRPRSTRI